MKDMKTILCLFLALLLMGCNAKNAKTSIGDSMNRAQMADTKAADEPADNVSLPATATLADQNGDFQLFLNVEEAASEDAVAQVTSVWLVNKKTGVVRKLLVSNPDADLQWEKMKDNNAITVPIEQVAAADKACFVPGDEGVILVEGCPEARNIWTYFIDVNRMTAKQFPSTEGLIRFDENNRLVVLGSYRYHDEGGRYSVEKTFSYDGVFQSEVIGEDE